MSYSVLCVDRDQEACDLLQKELPDYKLTFVDSALEALRHVNRQAFHAYILEFWLRDWGGSSLCREIRRIDPHGPVIFYTGSARESDKQRAIKVGANAFLRKPIHPDELRAKLRVLLGMADFESLQAKVAENIAIQEELQRRLEALQSRLQLADVLVEFFNRADRKDACL